MSTVEGLLHSFSPEGVEFARLGDVIRIKNGRDYKHLGFGEVPVYGTGGVIAHVDKPAHPGPSVLIPRKGSLDKLYYVSGPFRTVDTIFYSEIGERLEPKFLYYYLQTQRLEEMNKAGGVPSLTQGELNQLRIPVPPRDVQLEVVRVLDMFAELESELESEIRNRRELSSSVLRVGSRVHPTELSGRRLQIGDFAIQFVQPFRVEKDGEYVNLGVKWYGEGVFAREAKSGAAIAAKTLYRVKAGQFIYNRMFVTEGSFGLVPAELSHGVVSNEFPVFDIDRKVVMPEWLNLYFRDPFVVAQVARQAEGGTKSRRRWKEAQFLDFVIEVPEMEEQERIVGYARAMNELDSNLRAELAARRKQYEYYRDKLLTFEEAPA